MIPTKVKKAKVIIVASPRARLDPSSPLMRLLRDHSASLKKFEIHTTQGTGNMIKSSGFYDDEVNLHRSGRDGGIAELAAIAARGDCVAAILFLDPSEAWSDAVENRALKRVCIRKRVRLITTYTAAVHWANYEAPLYYNTKGKLYNPTSSWKPVNWREGEKNVNKYGEFRQLNINKRSIALISHDKQKLEMVKFAMENAKFLSKYDRVLATGTTGWLIKFLFANKQQENTFKLQYKKQIKEENFLKTLKELLKEAGKIELSEQNFDVLLEKLKEELKTIEHKALIEIIMTLPSGPEGGDVLIANEVLNNTCHSLIFFHDPMTAHPHNDDIRLLEHTCQIPGIFAECVSDKESADKWIAGQNKELNNNQLDVSLAQKVRQKYNLKEAILVNTENNTDSDELGKSLTRACAGYFNQLLTCLLEEKEEIRIGIAWGWGTKCLIEELEKMARNNLIKKPTKRTEAITWSPLIGIVTSEVTDWEASTLTEEFKKFYGGHVESFSCAGFARQKANRSEMVNKLISKLENADIIITSASPWNDNTSLYKYTGLKHEYLPKFNQAVGLLSGIFLDIDGKEVEGEYSIVGLGYNGFQNAAIHGTVIVTCGGEKRRSVLLAALRGGLVSVVITNTLTAEWILRQDSTNLL